MFGIRLFSSNRLEALVEKLADIFRKPLRSPFHKEIIVVQSKGMERWVSMELANRLGICANTWFPFPNALLDEMFVQLMGEIPAPSPFDPAILTWKIMRVLPACFQRPAFEPLKNYVAGDQQELKRFQLAERIAYLFDQYLVFRPEMMLLWDQHPNGHDDWQPLLWRELTRDCEVPHRAALHQMFLDRLKGENLDREHLPERIAVFGISALPPFHLEVLEALSHHIQVNLFWLNPCQEYWADIRSEREMARITGKTSGPARTSEELHLETGHSLLASMGALGRDFFQLIQDAVGEIQEIFAEPGETTLLNSLQSDILHLVERTGANPSGPLTTSPVMREGRGAGADRSVMVHSCHSPMREIEVLYDHLLAMFEDDPTLAPRNILVMTPDIDAYAPYIHAVFAAPEDPGRRIPYSISDRSMRREGQVSEALLAILDLVGSRFEASRVLNVLEAAPVRRRLALDDDHLEQIRRWVSATRIRWGIDAGHRERLGFGAFPENTWMAGFQRLLLGYAMPGYGEHTFAGILPYDDIEGSSTAVLGTFLQFSQDLFTAAAGLSQPRPLARWAEDLGRVLDQFLDPGVDGEKEMQTVRQATRDLAGWQQGSGFTDAVGVDVIRAYLTRKLDAAAMGTGFITGGVTFCAMLPMRSIPCRVIALIGMNDGAFPRQDRSPGFDLMARAPRRGDRSQRSDDRYLFLEALLSARKTLYISYVGQSLQDNSAIPPSVLVSELLDVIQRGYAVPGRDILAQVLTRHRLHPFSPHYFSKRIHPATGGNGQEDRITAGLFSYSRENLEASRKLQTQRQPPGPFFAAPLPEPEDEWRTVDIDRLCRFFTHPVRFLLQQRLQILLEAGDEAIEDREAFDLDHLERYLVKENLLARRLAHQDLGPALELERALGRLPHGQVGECRFTALSRDVNAFYLDLEPYVRAPMLEPLTIDLELGGFRLLGRLDGFFEAGTTPGDGSGHPMHSPPLADNAADSVLSSPPLRGAGGNTAELRNVRLTTGGDKPRPYDMGRRSGVGAGFIPARNGPMTVAHSIALGDQGGGMATNGSPPPDLPRQEGGKPGKDYRRALMVRFRSAKVTARDRLNLWIRHLALNAAETALVHRTSILLGTDGAWEYAPVPDASERLRQLLEIYWQGLCQPLKFFPKLSYAYAQAVRAGKPPEAALAAARQGWQGSGPGDQRPPGEAEDPYHTLCFAAREPIDDEFMQLAAAVFDPVLDHEQKAANAGYVSPLA